MYEVYMRDTSIYKYEIKKRPCNENFSKEGEQGHLLQTNLKGGQELCSQIFSLDQENLQLINPGNGIVADFNRISNDYSSTFAVSCGKDKK